MADVFVAVLGGVVAVLNIAFWILVATRFQSAFRRRVERAFGVTLTNGYRGHWTATGPHSRPALLGIELLQLAYFLGAFVVWGVLLGLCIAVIQWVERAQGG